jgi:hypothetical protein
LTKRVALADNGIHDDTDAHTDDGPVAGV